jgi:hypothetical protein
MAIDVPGEGEDTDDLTGDGLVVPVTQPTGGRLAKGPALVSAASWSRKHLG